MIAKCYDGKGVEGSEVADQFNGGVFDFIHALPLHGRGAIDDQTGIDLGRVRINVPCICD